MPYLKYLDEFWGELCATPEIASKWADYLSPTLTTMWNHCASTGEYGYFRGTPACLSSLYAAGLGLIQDDNPKFMPEAPRVLQFAAKRGGGDFRSHLRPQSTVGTLRREIFSTNQSNSSITAQPSFFSSTDYANKRSRPLVTKHRAGIKPLSQLWRITPSEGSVTCWVNKCLSRGPSLSTHTVRHGH